MSTAAMNEVSEIVEFLASLLTPEEILKLKPSPHLTTRVHAFLERNRSEGLTVDEQEEWDRYEHIEHLVRISKSRARAKLSSESANG